MARNAPTAMQPLPHHRNVAGGNKSEIKTENPLDSNMDVISDVLAFCPTYDFLYMASVGKAWRTAWTTACGRSKSTAISMAASTPARTTWIADDRSFWLSVGAYVAMSSAMKNSTISCNGNNSISSSTTATAATTTTTTTTTSTTNLNTAPSFIATTTTSDNGNGNNNGNNNIFCMAAAAGNLFGLKMAAMKFSGKNNARSSAWSTSRKGSRSSGSRGSDSNRRGKNSTDNNISSNVILSDHDDITNGTNSMVAFARRRVPEIAAEIGHLEMLRWAVSQQGYPLKPSVFYFAAKGGSLQVLEWLVVRGCPKDLYSCAMGAASGGSLEALKWSRRQGHGWDRFVCFSAASRGDLEMLRWARGRDCPWDRQQCARVAGVHGHQNVVEWVNGQA